MQRNLTGNRARFKLIYRDGLAIGTPSVAIRIPYNAKGPSLIIASRLPHRITQIAAGDFGRFIKRFTPLHQVPCCIVSFDLWMKKATEKRRTERLEWRAARSVSWG